MATDKGLEDVPEGKFSRPCSALSFESLRDINTMPWPREVAGNKPPPALPSKVFRHRSYHYRLKLT